MKGLEWGVLYNKCGAGKYDLKQLEACIVDLMQDDDITKFSGIYEYLLSGEDKKAERLLSIRAFTPKMAWAAYERQKGNLPGLKKTF